MANRIPDIGGLVQIRGEDGRIWRVAGKTYALGTHDEIARLVVPPGQESWNRQERVVSVRLLVCCPPDLEDFPCSPI